VTPRRPQGAPPLAAAALYEEELRTVRGSKQITERVVFAK